MWSPRTSREGRKGHSATVDLLIEYGADVNRQWSPLTTLAGAMNMRYLHVAISQLDAEKKDDAEKRNNAKKLSLNLSSRVQIFQCPATMEHHLNSFSLSVHKYRGSIG